MITAAQDSAMVRALDDLRSQLLSAELSLSTSWSFDQASSDAATAALANVRNRALPALEAYADRVRRGEVTYSAWVSSATELHNTIAAIVGDSNLWNLSGMLSSVVGDTAGQVASGAKSAVDAVKDYGPTVALLVVVALVAVAAIYLAPHLPKGAR